MRTDATPWARGSLTLEDKQAIAAAEPQAATAFLIRSSRTKRFSCQIHKRGVPLAYAEGSTAREAFDGAAAKLPAVAS